MGRTGSVAGTLAVREGLRAPVPGVDSRPILTLADIAMVMQQVASNSHHPFKDHFQCPLLA